MWWAALLLSALLLNTSLYDDGVRLLEAGRWTEARDKFAAAVEYDPKDARAWKALGVASGRMGDVAEAEEAFRKGCEANPRLEDVCYFHARSLYTLNRFIPAISALGKLTRTESRKGRAWTALGQAYEANGDALEAEAAFRKALEQADGRGEALLRYGIFLFRSGRLEETERALREAVKQQPVSPEAEAELGRVYYQQGKLREAISLLEGSARSVEWAGLLLEKVKRQLEAKGRP